MPLSTLRMVCGAMLAGLALFLGLAHAAPHLGLHLGAPASAPVLRVVWLGAALANVLAFVVVRQAQRRRARAQVEAAEALETKVEHVRAAYTQTTFIGCALAEGTGMLGVVIALLSRVPSDFWLAGLPMLAFVVLFPTEARLERWADAIL